MIVSAEAIAEEVYHRRSRGLSIVFTNGCFDIIHYGHIQLLNECRKHGDIVVVGVNSDDSIQRLKGPSRPIFSEQVRLEVLDSLRAVDLLVLFDEDTPLDLIKSIWPDVLVKGGEYRKVGIVGADFVESYGGDVVRFPMVSAVNTTKILERLTSNADSSVRLL